MPGDVNAQEKETEKSETEIIETVKNIETVLYISSQSAGMEKEPCMKTGYFPDLWYHRTQMEFILLRFMMA